MTSGNDEERQRGGERGRRGGAVEDGDELDIQPKLRERERERRLYYQEMAIRV